jgi:hypothetical protein
LWVSRGLLDPKQGLRVAAAFGLLHATLVRQKRRRLGKEDGKRAQGRIFDLVGGIVTLAAMVRQLIEALMKDSYQIIES